MAVRLKKYSFRFSEELFNSRLAQKAEIEQILYAACVTSLDKGTQPFVVCDG